MQINRGEYLSARMEYPQRARVHVFMVTLLLYIFMNK